MVCFFKLTSKIVRATQPALSKGWAWCHHTAVHRALDLKKHQYLYSNVLFLKKISKNAGIITHSFYIDFHFIVNFFNCLALSSGPCFFWTQSFTHVLSKQPRFRSCSHPSHRAAGAGCWKWERWTIAVVICELSESKGISQGAYTRHLTRSRADVMPSGRAASLWQEQDNVCAERLYRLNFSSNATNASGKSWMLMLEGTGITLKTWSGFRNTTLGLLRRLPLP